MLVVINEASVAMNVKGMFVDWGFDVVGVLSNGRTALPLARDSHPDLLVMNVKVDGDLNGVETAIIIRSFFEEKLPVIFISGLPAANYPVLKALDSYVYLSKPLNAESLFCAMTQAEISERLVRMKPSDGMRPRTKPNNNNPENFHSTLPTTATA